MEIPKTREGAESWKESTGKRWNKEVKGDMLELNGNRSEAMTEEDLAERGIGGGKGKELKRKKRHAEGGQRSVDMDREEGRADELEQGWKDVMEGVGVMG